MITLLLSTLIALSPSPEPTPPGPVLPPSMVVNGDGTRMQCTPGGYSCWPDTSGLPFYLED
jgi:hypothetical protein